MELNTEIINLIKNLDYNEQEKLAIILKKLDKIDESSKIKLLQETISAVLLKLELMENKKYICENEGHAFMEWESTFLSKYKNEDELVKYWKRKCTRCGLIDVSSKDPNEEVKGINK